MNSRKVGGKVIGSGGYGCIFNPSLKCKNKKSKKSKNRISKLLYSKDAKNEWQEFKNVKNIINKIDNYKNYFIIDNISICSPDKLTNKDKINLDKCESTFSTFNLNSININDNIKDFKIINMDYGGIDLTKIIYYSKLDFKTINKLLINLLKNAINKMNRLDFFHSDIKAQNLLYLDNKIKIIDFGISFYINDNTRDIPDIILNHKIQYNSLLSRILFNSHFDKLLYSFLISNKNINRETIDLDNKIKKFLLDYYESWIEHSSGKGHEDFINKYFIQGLFNLNNIVDVPNINFTAILFSEYCYKILIKYINFDTKKLDKKKYFNEVYLKNLDIIGFLSVYIDFIINNNTIYSKNLKISISNLLIDYFYNNNYSDKPIDIEVLLNDLNKLNDFNSLNDINVVNLEKLFNL